MPLFDMPIDELEAFRPSIDEPSDFDRFWTDTLRETDEQALDISFTRVAPGLENIEAFDLSFVGFGGQRINGWMLIPGPLDEPRPCVVPSISATQAAVGRCLTGFFGRVLGTPAS